MIEAVDIIYGLAWGDEGKGKIANAMAKHYDFVYRWNGGPNAGHTVYVNGKKYKTHIIPSGIFAGKKCIIGPGCVININKMLEELSMLTMAGYNIDLVKVHPNAHIITEDHIAYDKEHLSHLGTTAQGIAPCYSDKMLRRGKRAIDILESNWIWDGELSGKVLCEGAQSVWLDIDHGDYPYVTSSTTMPYGACSLGFSPKKVRRIIGVAKAYDTKSGVDPLFPTTLWNDPVLNKIIELGGEYGSTTGRKRLVNWLNLDKLKKAILLSGCTEVIINKYDILEQVNEYKVIHGNELQTFSNFRDMKRYVMDALLMASGSDVHEVTWSGNPEKI